MEENVSKAVEPSTIEDKKSNCKRKTNSQIYQKFVDTNGLQDDTNEKDEPLYYKSDGQTNLQQWLKITKIKCGRTFGVASVFNKIPPTERFPCQGDNRR